MPAEKKAAENRQGVTVTIPRPVVDIAAAPFAIAGRVLPAKKGLPVYVGLGVLAVADAIAWPVAAGIGVAYASMRRFGGPRQDAPAGPEPAPAPTPAPSKAQRETAGS